MLALVGWVKEDSLYINSEEMIVGMENSAYGIDYHKGKLYIGDFRHKKVIITDTDFNRLYEISVDFPHGICVEGEFIYVANYHGSKFVKLSLQGEEIWSKDIPNCVSVDIYNNYIYIIDYVDGKTMKLDMDGNFISSYTSTKPHGLITDGKYVYVADKKENSIIILTLDLEYVKHIQLDFMPLSIRIIEGDLFIPDYRWSKIYTFNFEGEMLNVFEETFYNITNLTSDGEYIYTVEEKTNRVTKYRR